MPADAALMETLLRIEHKLDLLLEGQSGIYPLVGDPNHTCPVCGDQVRYGVDLIQKVAIRKCGCSTGKQAPMDLGAFAPPALPARTTGRDHGDSNEQEDRSNPTRRGAARRG